MINHQISRLFSTDYSDLSARLAKILGWAFDNDVMSMRKTVHTMNDSKYGAVR